MIALLGLMTSVSFAAMTHQQYMDIHDKNRDGRLSDAELLVNYDKDGNRVLSAEEKKAAKQDYRIKVYDINGDGEVSDYEMRKVKQRIATQKAILAQKAKDAAAKKQHASYEAEKSAAAEKNKALTGNVVAKVNRRPKRPAGGSGSC